MASDPARPRSLRPLLAVAAGGLVGLGLALLAGVGDGPGTARRIEIGIDGVPARLSRDLLLPPHGWTLEVAVTEEHATAPPPGLVVELREERTGLTIEIQDELVRREDRAFLVVPEALGIREGLLAIRARATFADGGEAEDWRRLRIRRFFGGPPIGEQQQIHFDFGVDRDGDGRPDFERDLEALGLASTDAPVLGRTVADRVARRALARVERAFAGDHDPNHTGRSADPVAVRFRLEPVTVERERPYTTRICVGGRDPAHPGSLGHVPFDAHNAIRSGEACTGPQPAGLFPAELPIFEASPLYRAVFGPFAPALGGTPYGHAPGEADGSPSTARRDGLERAIAVLGNVLGTLMAHETGHALGLVPPDTPPVGLFGGLEGEAFAHAPPADPAAGETPSLMEPGRGFSFEALAGEGQGGELRFRALDFAYLRDRLVLDRVRDPRRSPDS